MIIRDILRSLDTEDQEAETPKYIQHLVLYHHSSTPRVRLLYNELLTEYEWLDCILKGETDDTLDFVNIAALFCNSESITFLMTDDDILSESQCSEMMQNMILISMMALDVEIKFVWSSLIPKEVISRLSDASIALYGKKCSLRFDSKAVQFRFADSVFTFEGMAMIQSRIEWMITSLEDKQRLKTKDEAPEHVIRKHDHSTMNANVPHHLLLVHGYVRIQCPNGNASITQYIHEFYHKV